jgi:hypothetical protein
MATLSSRSLFGRQGSRAVARVKRRDFERHAREDQVQRLIARARMSWRSRYGTDPAAGRLRDGE